MKLVQRVTNISLKPKSEWEVIATEPTSTADIYKHYILPLAAIGPLALFIGMSLVGISIPFMGSIRVPVGIGLSTALSQYAITLVSLYVIALMINALAPAFGGEKNAGHALKLAAYAATPVWVAGALQVLPALSVIVILAALYSLYVLYVGIPVMMKAPQDRAVGYAAVTVVCVIVVTIVGTAVTTAVTGASLLGQAGTFSTGAVSETGLSAATIAEARRTAIEKQDAEEAADAGASLASAAAALGEVAKAAGGTVQVAEPVDYARLKALLPEALPGMGRLRAEAEKTKLGEFALSTANATYGERNGDGPTIEVRVTDHGANPMGAIVALGSSVWRDRETETEIAKTATVNGYPTHETAAKDGTSSSYTIAVAKRFLVEIEGHQVDMAAVKRAGDKIDLARLAAMKDEGVKR